MILIIKEVIAHPAHIVLQQLTMLIAIMVIMEHWEFTQTRVKDVQVQHALNAQISREMGIMGSDVQIV